MITAKYIHESCYNACLECPQFQEIDEDQRIDLGFGEEVLFWKIPKQGIYKTILYWKEDRLLWDMGYNAALPDDVKKIFKDIDAVIANAIANYCKGVE